MRLLRFLHSMQFLLQIIHNTLNAIGFLFRSAVGVLVLAILGTMENQIVILIEFMKLIVGCESC